MTGELYIMSNDEVLKAPKSLDFVKMKTVVDALLEQFVRGDDSPYVVLADYPTTQNHKNKTEYEKLIYSDGIYLNPPEKEYLKSKGYLITQHVTSATMCDDGGESYGNIRLNKGRS
jgi:hypothetical protein